MATYYDIPGGLAWVKSNLQIIIGNKPLDEIMNFGDTWRSRGHTPLVHVISPAMDNGAMWDRHVDPSGLLDNIPSHIDMFIVDFYNLEKPELPGMWWTKAWKLWEYKSSQVRFNGSHSQFVSTFKIDPETTPVTPTPPAPTIPPTTPGTTLGSEVTIHMVCPHCGTKIY